MQLKEFDSLLIHLKQHTALATDIEERFLLSSSSETNKSERKNNFFIYHFLNRTVAYSESIALLVENEFYHEAILVARAVLEGLIFFAYYQSHHDIADKWGIFTIYEEGKKTANEAALDAVGKWLKGYEKKSSKELIDRAEEDFGFNYLPKETVTFHKNTLPAIINKIEDVNLRRQVRRQYDIIYYQFSQIEHWSPSGVIGGDVNVFAALTVTLDALFEMSREADKKYNLGFEKKLLELKEDTSKIIPLIRVTLHNKQTADIPKLYLHWMSDK